MNWSTNFRDWQLNAVMAQTLLNHMSDDVTEFVWRPMLRAGFSWLYKIDYIYIYIYVCVCMCVCVCVCVNIIIFYMSK